MHLFFTILCLLYIPVFAAALLSAEVENYYQSIQKQNAAIQYFYIAHYGQSNPIFCITGHTVTENHPALPCNPDQVFVHGTWNTTGIVSWTWSITDDSLDWPGQRIPHWTSKSLNRKANHWIVVFTFPSNRKTPRRRKAKIFCNEGGSFPAVSLFAENLV